MKPTGATAVIEDLNKDMKTINLADHLDFSPESVVKSDKPSDSRKLQLDKLTTPSGDSKSTTRKGVNRSITPRLEKSHTGRNGQQIEAR